MTTQSYPKSSPPRAEMMEIDTMYLKLNWLASIMIPNIRLISCPVFHTYKNHNPGQRGY